MSKMIGSKRRVRSNHALRVNEGGVHGPVEKFLVEQDAVEVLEQDAVDVLHCGSTQKTAVRATKSR